MGGKVGAACGAGRAYRAEGPACVYIGVMKTSCLIPVCCLAALPEALAQFGVGYNQSNSPFIGIQYELSNQRIVPEFCGGVDNDLEDLSLELVAAYAFVVREEYKVYGGPRAAGRRL